MALLYCECGHHIWSELWWKEPKDVLLFFDDVEASETYGEQVTCCPGCGRGLRSGVLKPEAVEHGSGARRHRQIA